MATISPTGCARNAFVSPGTLGIRSIVGLLGLCVAGVSLSGETAVGQGRGQRPVGPTAPAKQSPDAGREHPLEVPLRMAREAQSAYEKIRDYEALLISQERVDGKLGRANSMQLKFRREPFSVYLRWNKPHTGREAIYVAGRNNGKLIVHETGLKDAVAGTLRLDPRSKRAMKNNRHPITDAGIGNMIDQMITTWTRELRYGEIDVKMIENKRIDGRDCVGIQIYHPQPRREFQYCLSRIYIDKELKLPVQFEGYDWPRRRGGRPELVEAYIYKQLKLNRGLSERDFDTRNPQYSFRR